MSSSAPSALSAPLYATCLYPDSHFALSVGDKGEPWYVATLQVGGADEPLIMVRLNPNDARGFQATAVLVTESTATMRSTLNRGYTVDEQFALGVVLALTAAAYSHEHLVPQINVAGDDAHAMVDGRLVIGNAKEPGTLYGHVIGRGDPSATVIGGSALGGPVPGALFNMRGDGKDAGNTSKTAWRPDDMRAFAARIAGRMRALVISHDEPISVRIVRSCLASEPIPTPASAPVTEPSSAPTATPDESARAASERFYGFWDALEIAITHKLPLLFSDPSASSGGGRGGGRAGKRGAGGFAVPEGVAPETVVLALKLDMDADKFPARPAGPARHVGDRDAFIWQSFVPLESPQCIPKETVVQLVHVAQFWNAVERVKQHGIPLDPAFDRTFGCLRLMTKTGMPLSSEEAWRASH